MSRSTASARPLSHRLLALLASVGVLTAAAVATAAPASAGTACASGYVCLFDTAGNGDNRERAFEFGIADYAPWQWGSYVGGWHLLPGTTINNSMDALNFQWNIDSIAFYDSTNGTGYITCYRPAHAGYRAWSSNNWNKASRHSIIPASQC